MQISGAAGGERHSSMFDGLLSVLAANGTGEKLGRGKHAQSRTAANR